MQVKQPECQNYKFNRKSHPNKNSIYQLFHMQSSQLDSQHSHLPNHHENQFPTSNYQTHRSTSRRELSPQIKIYNRNVYLRDAYRAMIEKNYRMEIKQLANSEKLDPSSYNILKEKMEHLIQDAVQQLTSGNQQDHNEELTFEQMCEVIYRTNEYIRKASKAVDVEQLLSQIWLYLKNYQLQNQYLDAKVFSTFLKILMDPKGFKPSQIKSFMINIDQFKHSSELKKQFFSKFPQLQEEALEDIQIFSLWFSVRRKYNLFTKKTEYDSKREKSHSRINEFKFQPEISRNSRIYAEKSLRKYLSSNKLVHQKNIHLNTSNDQENELHQYLSNKASPNLIEQRNLNEIEANELNYHELLYKRKLEKDQIINQSRLDNSHSKENINQRKATPSEIQQIVNKMYFVPEKKPDLDFKTLQQQEELKKCTFYPATLEYPPTKRNNVEVQGFQKQVNRLKRGREEKEKLKETFQNLGRPKNATTRGRTPSFLERDAPKLILQVNIGGGRIEKIKLHGNEDPKIVAKKFINKHSLQNSMLSVLEDLIDENLKNL